MPRHNTVNTRAWRRRFERRVRSVRGVRFCSVASSSRRSRLMLPVWMRPSSRRLIAEQKFSLRAPGIDPEKVCQFRLVPLCFRSILPDAFPLARRNSRPRRESPAFFATRAPMPQSKDRIMSELEATEVPAAEPGAPESITSILLNHEATKVPRQRSPPRKPLPPKRPSPSASSFAVRESPFAEF